MNTERAGTRLKIVRVLLGLQQSAFCDWLDIKVVRLKNIERLGAKVNEDEFNTIALNMPEVVLFIACGKPLSRHELSQAKSLINTIPSRVDSGLVPAEFNASMLVD